MPTIEQRPQGAVGTVGNACELVAKMKGDVYFSAVGDASRFKAERGGQAIEFAAVDGTYPDWRAAVSKPNELKLSGFAPAVLEGVVKAAGVICKAFGGKATSLIPVTGGDVAAMFGIGGITEAAPEAMGLRRTDKGGVDIRKVDVAAGQGADAPASPAEAKH